jgi:RimJ/RimL family protein N-acetyltransferase
MKYFKKLTGKKCYLSPINLEDVENFTEWVNNFHLTKYLTLIRQQISLEREREILEKLSRGEHYAIIDQELNKLIGIAGLHEINHIDNTCEFGLFIGDPDYWNQGYGEEASRLLLDYGFNILNMNNIMLLVIDYNCRAERCYKKIGFKEIGRRRQAYRIAGKYCDVIYMDLLSQDFKNSRIKELFSEQYEKSRKPKKLELADK